MPIRDWIQRNFSNPSAIAFLLLLAGGFALILFFRRILEPILAAIVIAYLLEGVVALLQERLLMRRLPAVLCVFVGFILSFLFLQFSLLPLLVDQATEFGHSLPGMVQKFQEAMLRLPETYPNLISETEVREFLARARSEIVDAGERIVSFSLNSVVKLIVYVFLVPFLVFFFLKDKQLIIKALTGLFPSQKELLGKLWLDIDHQIGNYIRGKLVEILIIWGVSALVFALIGLRVPILMGLLVGLSVLIPYIGVAAMTVPVALVAYFQWGASAPFLWAMIAYTVIQVVDGNVLAPYLQSEVVNLHPIVVIGAILIFGGLWGFWGVFFAVPLATSIRAIVRVLRPEMSPPASESDTQLGKSRP